MKPYFCFRRLFILLLLLLLPVAHGKTLHSVFPAQESGFDPATAADFHSPMVIQSIFETLYTFDYLARPVRLTPQTAAALPHISADGKTYTIRLKQGIYFAPDPAFAGQRRELTMADYVYAFKRLLDPHTHSPHAWMLTEKVLGAAEAVQKALTGQSFDYAQAIAGLELCDRYTLRIRLKQADYNFAQVLANYPASAVAREVIQRYASTAENIAAHPVGTGPYRLAAWLRGSRITLDRNPLYRGFIWNFAADSNPEDQRIVAQMAGKKMPQIDRIEIRVVLDEHTRWLAFQKRESDLLQLPAALTPLALDAGKLRPEFLARGVQLARSTEQELVYYYWNMRDPVVGGLSKEKIALRRALAMAYELETEIHLLWHGEVSKLEYPIPPGVAGYDPAYRSSLRFEPASANALLDKFGYQKGKDGWRRRPDGGNLVITYSTSNDAQGRAQAEIWKKAMDSIAIRMVADAQPPAELLKAAKQCAVQMRSATWSADYPDGDNFMQMFYGPNIGQSNSACVDLPEYNTLYRNSQALAPGAARDALYRKMVRTLEVNAVMAPKYAGNANVLVQARVLGYKKHPNLPTEWMYLDLKD